MDNLTIFIMGTGLLFFLLTCWALLDIASKNFGGIEKKAAWGFISLIPFIGPIIYFSLGFKRGKKTKTGSPESIEY
jgi:uncharacterized membrane protein YhaH (DUF805 family)